MKLLIKIYYSKFLSVIYFPKQGGIIKWVHKNVLLYTNPKLTYGTVIFTRVQWQKKLNQSKFCMELLSNSVY